MGTEVKITILTQAELAGAKAVEEQLQRDIGKAKVLGEEYGKLEEKLKRVRTNIAQGTVRVREEAPQAGRLDGLDPSINIGKGAATAEATMGRLAIAGRLAGIAAAAAGAAASKAIHEFAEYEEAVAGLDQSLARNGLLTDDYREKLQNLANDLEKTTNVADEKWIGVLQRLTQFGSTPESIGMDVDAVKNLAGVVGDVTTAATLYSRALQGHFEIFGRYGIQVDDVGTKTEKLQKLQEKLAAIGGGQLEARTKTLTGMFTGLGHAINNLFQGAGNAISRTDLIQAFLGPIITGLNRTADMLPTVAEKARGLKNAVGEVGTAFKDLDVDPFEKVGTGASEAKKKIDALIASIRAAAQQADESADAILAEDLANIDLEQSRTPSSPEADAAFGARRQQAQASAKHRQANRAFFAAGDRLRALQAARGEATDPEEQADLDRQIKEARGEVGIAQSRVRATTTESRAVQGENAKEAAERADAARIDEAKREQERTAALVADAIRELGGTSASSGQATIRVIESLQRENADYRRRTENLERRSGGASQAHR